MSETAAASEELHLKAVKLFQERQYQQAAEILNEVLRTVQTSELWNDWATTHLMCNQGALSEQGYRRALQMDPANFLAAGNLGVLLAATGRIQEALPLLEQAAAGSRVAQRDILVRLIEHLRGKLSEVNRPETANDPAPPNPPVNAAPAQRQASPARSAEPGVYFQGIVYGGSGYAEEASVEAAGVAEHGIPLQLIPIGPARDEKNLLPAELRCRLESLERRKVDLNRSVFLQYAMAHLWDMDTCGRRRIVRTMFETDRLPDGVPERCNRMDEVWVPTRFNIETYARAGVSEKKLRVVPPGVDTRLFCPGAAPLQVPQKRNFNFLSVFDWQQRKGYDVLLRAYLHEFKPDEDVALILKVSLTHPAPAGIEDRLVYFVEREAGLPLEKAPAIILINGLIPQRDMPALYAAADCFVLPTRGEGYGRPFMEALACQCPVIATGWSGQTEFLNSKNSYLIDYRVVPVPHDVDVELFTGQRWAEPDVDHLRQLMRRVFSQREESRQRALQGRADMVQRYDWSVIIPQWVAEFRRLLN
jgi:glycosyltransferase involved in cell wall biosynthesis